MIEVHELSKRYGPFSAVDNVTFQVAKGEILGFLGPNGAGKSTTMRILTGALGATSGKAAIGGWDVAENPREAKMRIGYLPEIPPVYPEMSVRDYLDYAARLHYVPRAERKTALKRVLAQCDLSSVADRIIGHLSKGFQQRVGLAQALVHDPPVLILDEPTVGLDPNQIKEIRQLIRNLAGKHTIILSTHILPEVQMTCQRVIIINKGRIVAQDTIENLSHQVSHGLTLSVVLQRPTDASRSMLALVEGVSDVTVDSTYGEGTRFIVSADRGTDVREPLAELCVGQKWGLTELSQIRISLEDVFRELTTDDPSKRLPMDQKQEGQE